jgi:hypothetical protein
VRPIDDRHDELAELDDLYDDETMARIDAPDETPARPLSKVRRRSGAGAVAAAMMMGLREVFDPPTNVEIEQVDPWTGGGSNPWVRIHYDPDPRHTVAEVTER